MTKALADAGLRGEIVLVANNSGTHAEEICTSDRGLCPVRLVARTPGPHRSHAVLEAMRAASGSVYVVMNADLSHPPEMIPEMIEALLTDGTDFVIGSRFVPGAGTDATSGRWRRLQSSVARWLARPLTNVRDPMSGFFVVRRDTVEAGAPFDPIVELNALELIVRCRCHAVREIPIAVCHRIENLGLNSQSNQFAYCRQLLRLYEFAFAGWVQLTQFVLVGSSGAVVDLGVFTLLLLALPRLEARGMAIWIAMTWNFVLNRSLTFRFSRSRPVVAQFVWFCLSCSVGALVNWVTFLTLTTVPGLLEESPTTAALAGIVMGTGFNFALSKFHVFK
jgi:dolichol-phosphate mannosyltransferase